MAGSPRSQRLVRASRSSVQGFASGFLPTPPRDDAVASGSGLASPPPLEDFHLQALAHAGRTTTSNAARSSYRTPERLHGWELEPRMGITAFPAASLAAALPVDRAG